MQQKKKKEGKAKQLSSYLRMGYLFKSKKNTLNVKKNMEMFDL